MDYGRILTNVLRTRVVVFMLAIAVAFPGARGWAAADEAGDEPSRKAGGTPIDVEVVTPTLRTLVRELKMPATLIADERVDLFAKTSGYVDHIGVDIGSKVRKGDVLATIAVPEMHDELQQAQAVLEARKAKVQALEAGAAGARQAIETARAEVRQYAAKLDLDEISLRRKQQLREGNAIPEQALDEARGAHAVAEAQLAIAHARVAAAEAALQAAQADIMVARAQVNVEEANRRRLQTLMQYATIKAPFDGVITVRNVDHGTFVRSAAEGATGALLRIEKTNRIRIVLEIPEVDSTYVRVGTEADVNIRASAQPQFTAAVTRIAGALKPETRSMRAEIDIDNRDGRFAPGMYAQVVLKLQSTERAMVIPSKAVRLLGRDTVVLVSNQGVADAKPVKIGYDDGIWAEILSGLHVGDLVITSAGGTVTAGTAVAPIPSDS